MYIEDILKATVTSDLSYFHYLDQKIMVSLWAQLHNNLGFTKKQGTLCVNILKKYKNAVSLVIGQNLDNFTENPEFKIPFREINSLKTITVVSDSTYVRAIRVEFPYDEELIQKFQKHRANLQYAHWDKEEKCWILNLCEKNIKFAMSLVAENGFTYDDTLKNFFDQVVHIQDNIENLVPMATIENGLVKFVNISQYTPQNTSTDLLESIFFAKEVGISVWDEPLEQQIDQLPFGNLVKQFLNHDPGKTFEINLADSSLFELLPIIKHLLPCLIVISASNELEKLEKNLEFFHNIGLTNKEMSVLFRLPSESNSEFNQYVKLNELNSPLSKNTKVAFVSGQIPKTILGADIEFNSVLNYNYYSAHYRLRDFIKWHKNVFNILENSQQKRINFGLLQNHN